MAKSLSFYITSSSAICGAIFFIAGIVSLLMNLDSEIARSISNALSWIPLKIIIPICKECFAGGLGILMLFILTFVEGAVIGALIGWIYGLIKTRGKK